jgi:integrase/recombinase XerC
VEVPHAAKVRPGVEVSPALGVSPAPEGSPAATVSLAERYLQELVTQRGFSPRTVAGYRADLAILGRLVSRGKAKADEPVDSPASAASTAAGTELPWAALSEHDLRSWVASESRVGRAPSSIARRLSAWRGFYDWLAAQGKASANPARGVRAPRRARRLPKALSPEQATSLVAGVAALADPAVGASYPGSAAGRGCPDEASASGPSGAHAFEALRDAAMLELLYSSGLRLSELTSLDCRYIDGASSSWYDASESEVTVTGKGGRRRTVPVGSHAHAALRRWLDARADWLARHPSADARALFLSLRGRRLANRTVQMRLKRIAIERGIPAQVHPHVLRHSFASHLLQSSGDLRAVQELLGHASIATTQIYTSLDFQRLAAVYDAAHPRARRR